MEVMMSAFATQALVANVISHTCDLLTSFQVSAPSLSPPPAVSPASISASQISKQAPTSEDLTSQVSHPCQSLAYLLGLSCYLKLTQHLPVPGVHCSCDGVCACSCRSASPWTAPQHPRHCPPLSRMCRCPPCPPTRPPHAAPVPGTTAPAAWPPGPQQPCHPRRLRRRRRRRSSFRRLSRLAWLPCSSSSSSSSNNSRCARRSGTNFLYTSHSSSQASPSCRRQYLEYSCTP